MKTHRLYRPLQSMLILILAFTICLAMGQNVFAKKKSSVKAARAGSGLAGCSGSSNESLGSGSAGPSKGTLSSRKGKVSIKMNKGEIMINLQDSDQARLKAKTRNAGSSRVVWKSNNRGVVRVDQKGRLTAVGKGRAVVTAKVRGTRAKTGCTVWVTNYKIMRMRTTGYCNCRRCAGKWAGHATASGKMPRANHTIAVDPGLIKLGTRVQIGDTIYTAEDTGGAIKGHRIDVYYKSHRSASRHGVKYQTVKVLY